MKLKLMMTILTKKKYKSLIDNLQTKITEGEYSETFYDFTYFLLDIIYKYDVEETIIIETKPREKIETQSEIIMNTNTENEKEKVKAPKMLLFRVGAIVLIIIIGLVLFFKRKKEE